MLNFSACTRFAFIAYSINSIGLVILGFNCSFPDSTCVIFSNSPVILSSRSLFSLILFAKSSCSSFKAPIRWSSNNCRLIIIAEIGVFNSCEIVEINVVLAESSSLNSVIFFNIMTYPFFSIVTPSFPGWEILMYFTWKKLSLLSA